MNFTRESIFITALRGFFKAFAVVLGISVALLLLVLGLGAFSTSVSTPKKSELTISADANWSRKALPDSAPVILKINIEGVIGTLKLKTEKFKNILLDSREGVLANNRVKAILLYVNTPGGTAIDANGIYQLLKDYKERYKTPIYVYVDGVCASGGMYISCVADKVFASPESIVGSIGVRIGPTFNVSEVMNKIGIKSLTLTEGKNKDMLNPFRPWEPNEDESLKKIVAEGYDRFVEIVTENRKQIDKEKLINVYGANIFDAKKGQEIGYIDNGDATYDQALASLVNAAGIKDTVKYQVIEIEPYQSVLSELAENKSKLLQGKIEHSFSTGSYLTPEMSGQLLYLYQP